MAYTQSSEIDDAAAAPDGPFHLIVRAERLWWPYRTFCQALLHMQPDRASILEIRRKMVAEAAAILRLEKDMIAELSATILEHASPDQDRWNQANKHFDHAIECVRALGEAVIAMQVDALEAMRDNSKQWHGGDSAAAAPKQKIIEIRPHSPTRARDEHPPGVRAHATEDHVFQ
jgi:hypothetical protein